MYYTSLHDACVILQLHVRSVSDGVDDCWGRRCFFAVDSGRVGMYKYWIIANGFTDMYAGS